MNKKIIKNICIISCSAVSLGTCASLTTYFITAKNNITKNQTAIDLQKTYCELQNSAEKNNSLLVPDFQQYVRMYNLAVDKDSSMTVDNFHHQFKLNVINPRNEAKLRTIRGSIIDDVEIVLSHLK
jgi:hypothetical protein